MHENTQVDTVLSYISSWGKRRLLYLSFYVIGIMFGHIKVSFNEIQLEMDYVMAIWNSISPPNCANLSIKSTSNKTICLIITLIQPKWNLFKHKRTLVPVCNHHSHKMASLSNLTEK